MASRREDRMKIAQRLRQARQWTGLTQAAVGRQLGWHRETVTQIERGQRGVKAEELARLSELYAVPLHELLRPLHELLHDPHKEIIEDLARQIEEARDGE